MTTRGRVLVTGATGFVGSAVVRALLHHGYPVRAYCRASSARANLTGLDIETAYGDICDANALAQALDGVRFLVHAAADYRLWARDPATILRTNVDGTRIVMGEASRARLDRVVYTSSVATLALRPTEAPADESARAAESAALGAYKRSKIAAEKCVQRAIEQDALPAVIVHPSTPIGPRDIRPTPTGRIIVEAASGRVPAYVDTGLNLVHVDDVAAGHVLALMHGRIGERYILGGDNVTLERMLSDIASLVGRAAPRLRLPRAPLYPIARVAELIASVTGREPFLTVDGLRMSKQRMFFTSAKAARELGYSSRPYREGLNDAIFWFQRAGYLS
jgi:dihydroflavonol-4-reductase